MQVHSWPCKFMHGQLSKGIINEILKKRILNDQFEKEKKIRLAVVMA